MKTNNVSNKNKTSVWFANKSMIWGLIYNFCTQQFDQINNLKKKQQQTNKQKDKLNCYNPLVWMQLYYHEDIFFSK